jgi:hypothetical protein
MWHAGKGTHQSPVVEAAHVCAISYGTQHLQAGTHHCTQAADVSYGAQRLQAGKHTICKQAANVRW